MVLKATYEVVYPHDHTNEFRRPKSEVAMSGIQLTVLLATRNGAHVLPRTLEGYRRGTPPSFGWKLVVVDNGSTDATSDILKSFEAHLPLQALQQPIPGKNRSLNAGIHLAEGSLLVLTDDDAIPHSSFLMAWGTVLEIHADYELFGGSIEPLFEVPPPKWLMESRLYFAMMFAERALPDGPVAPGAIYGPNMAVRMSVVKAGFRFDERPGPGLLERPVHCAGSADPELFRSLCDCQKSFVSDFFGFHAQDDLQTSRTSMPRA